MSRVSTISSSEAAAEKETTGEFSRVPSEINLVQRFPKRTCSLFLEQNLPPFANKKLKMSKIIIFLVLSIASLIGEELFFSKHAKLAPLYANSAKFGFSAPKLYGATIFINVVVSCFVMMMLGGKVGSARKRLAEQAKKDGDKDAEIMFALPKMQAEGFSDRYVYMHVSTVNL